MWKTTLSENAVVNAVSCEELKVIDLGSKLKKNNIKHALVKNSNLGFTLQNDLLPKVAVQSSQKLYSNKSIVNLVTISLVEVNMVIKITTWIRVQIYLLKK